MHVTDNLTQDEKANVRYCVKENGSCHTYQSVTGNEPDSARQQPGQEGQSSEPMFPHRWSCRGETSGGSQQIDCSAAIEKASGCAEIPAELCKSLKEDAVRDLHSLCQQI